MDVPAKERLARNEAFFRDVNERIRDVAERLEGETYDFLCECPDPACSTRIQLTLPEYEHIRANSTRFVLAPGHVDGEIEHVIEHGGDHLVVKKEGVAAEIAAQLDPRAG
jgi:hypothetical protein